MSAKTSEYYPRIWKAVAAIPYGRVASYGQIAELAGMARGARMVGRALGSAPDRMTLPWYRVLNAHGRIAIPKDSKARREQIQRLTDEGGVVNDGRVDMRRYHWVPDIDELVWGPLAMSDEDEDMST